MGCKKPNNNTHKKTNKHIPRHLETKYFHSMKLMEKGFDDPRISLKTGTCMDKGTFHNKKQLHLKERIFFGLSRHFFLFPVLASGDSIRWYTVIRIA
jgi:hypothetical protein